MGAYLEPRALDELLRHSAWLQRFARGLARDAHELDDGLQDTWCAALAHPPRPGHDSRPWLARVLKNFLLERRRSERSRARRDEQAARAEALPSSAEIVEAIELRALVLELLRAQREPYRRTLYLRYVEGLSAAEIARREELPEGTVRARVKRGLDAMRAALDERLGERGSWCALLLARFDAPHSLGAATRGLPLLGPVVAMSATAKALGVVLVLALAFGLWRVQRARSVEPASAPVVAAEAEREAAAEPRDAPAVEAAQLGRGELPAVPAIPAAKSDERDPAVESTFAPARIGLRFVDESGLGIADVLLRTAGTEHPGFVPIEAESDREGAVRVEVEMLASAATIYLYTTHPERARRYLELRLDAGGTTPLGDVLLLPTAALAGVVRDEAGRGMPGATIRVCPPETRNDPERSRRTGPVTSSFDGFDGETDGEGRFRIEGVAIGERRVWAGAEGFYWSATDAFPLTRDEERTDLELVLEPLPAELVLRGVVRAPDGEPVPYADLEAWCAPPEGRWRDQFHADASGRFATVVDFAQPHELRAVDRHGRWSPVYALDATPGGPELELQFRAPRWLTVRARGEEGEAIADFTAAVRFPGEERPHFIEMPRASEESALRLLAPERDFQLELQAPGYLPAKLGPYLAADAPAEIVATLTATPGVRGVVTAGGEPLEGAQVELGRLDAGQRMSLEGFACRFAFAPGGFATTGADGSFVINLSEPGRYVLVAHHPGYASAELGPLELDPFVGARDLRFELGPGGSIEGAVTLPDDSDPTGRIVAASRGDGHVCTTRVERDGRYRLEHLCPGPWQVALRGSELSLGGGFSVGTIGAASEPEPIPWSCEVFEGRATRYDLSGGDD